jgi:cell division protein FtsI (penicillin-binding protein 3)
VGDEVPPVDGKDIQLSIDSKVQFFAYQKLRDAVVANKAKSGSVVVMDAQTGEVLALANYPSYAPDNRKNLTGAQLRNIAITDTFEPGSTMKPITAAMGMEAGRITPQTVINTAPGNYQLGRFTIRDTHNYGSLTVEGVIQKSSNVGALKIAQKLRPQEMWETYTALGYGRKPELAFPGAATGRVRHWKNWKPMEQATMSYGYGLSASLFQMTHSYTAFSHGGEIIPATLLKRDSSTPVQGVRVFSDKNARAIRKMLAMAAGPGGTGQRAQTVGYSVGGKSGTAHKQVGKGYAANKYRSWFTGMAPIETPRLIVGVMIDEPSNGVYFGGAVAAPVFSEVVQQTLRIMGVQPDVAVKPAIVAEQVQESF